MELLDQIIQNKESLINGLDEMSKREPPPPKSPPSKPKPKPKSQTIINKGNKEAMVYYDYRFKANYGHYMTVLRYLTKMSDRYRIDLYHYKKSTNVRDLKEFIRKISKIYNHVYFYVYTLYPKLEIFSENNQSLFNMPKVTFFLNFFPNNNEMLDGLEWLKHQNISSHSKVVLTSDNYRTIQLLNQKLSPKNRSLYLPTPILYNLPDPAMLKYRTGHLTRVGVIYNRQSRTRTTLINFLRWAIPNFPKIQWDIIVNKLSDRDNLSRFMKNHREYSDRIKIHWDFLSASDFEKFYQKSNIIIINYEKDRDYIYRTSGILVEAIYYKSIVMTTYPNWLSRELNKFGSGKTHAKFDLESMKKNFIDITKNLKKYQIRADSRYDKFLKNYGIGNFYGRLYKNKKMDN
jgi:hypothetical protein